MTGKQIKKLREGLGWSQRQLGEYLGVEQATVSRLENEEWEPSTPVVKLLDMLASTPSLTGSAA